MRLAAHFSFAFWLTEHTGIRAIVFGDFREAFHHHGLTDERLILGCEGRFELHTRESLERCLGRGDRLRCFDKG
jgi:hypothetical protein